MLRRIKQIVLEYKQFIFLLGAYYLSFVAIVFPIAGILLLTKAPTNTAVAFIDVGLLFSMLTALYVVNRSRKKYKQFWSDLGFSKPTFRFLHLLWQIPVMVVSILLTAIVSMLIFGERNAPNKNIDSELLNSSPSPLLVIVFIIAIVVLAPIIEEIIYRGVLYKQLARKLPTLFAIVIVGIIFALSHFIPVLFIYYFVFSTALVLIFIFHKNIWAPIIAHGTMNLLVTLIALTSL